MYNTCKLLQFSKSSESNTKLKNNRAVEIYPQCHPERNFNEAQGCSEVPSGGWVQENLSAPHPSTLRAHSHQQGGNSTHKLGQGCFFCSGQLIPRILTGQTAKNICLLRVQPQGRHVCQLLHGAGDNMGENAERMQELEDEEESCRIRHAAAAPTKSLHL